MATYDGILLGAGHNALVLQAYLARAGLRTLTLERAAQPGGGLATIENPRQSGFLHNPHSFFHRAVTAMPWYRDLELEQAGARYTEPELNVAVVFRDGRVLEWWSDLERTVTSVARFSRTDAATLLRWADEFRPIVEQLLVPEAQSPPLEPARRRALLERTAAGRRLLQVSEASPLDFVLAEFEDDRVRAGLLFFNGLREVDLRLEGFGHAIPALLASPHKAQMCLGGSFELARALVKDIEEHGGEVRCGAQIRRLVVRGGRVVGVELEGGETVEASRFVASGLNPQQTFLELLPAEHAPPGLRERADGFRYNLLAPLFGLHLALDESPRYTAEANCPELADAFMVVLGLEGVHTFRDMVDAHEAVTAPPLVAWGANPTRFDPSQAPAGKHTSFLWQKVPYGLAENDGDSHGARLLEFWRSYAPNLTDGNVLDRFVLTPRDTERTLPNMYRGDLLVGSFEAGQVGYARPFVGAGRYSTPLDGLYLCGGSTHPGGNITGLCGYNAASIIAKDVGLDPWWERRDIEASLLAANDDEKFG